jgi:hypothetical protein
LHALKLKTNPLVLQATFDNEQLLIHPDTGRFFRLNVTAGRLYELLGSGASLESARDALLAEFDVPPQELDAEIERIVKSMQEEQLLVEEKG